MVTEEKKTLPVDKYNSSAIKKAAHNIKPGRCKAP